MSCKTPDTCEQTRKCFSPLSCRRLFLALRARVVLGFSKNTSEDSATLAGVCVHKILFSKIKKAANSVETHPSRSSSEFSFASSSLLTITNEPRAAQQLPEPTSTRRGGKKILIVDRERERKKSTTTGFIKKCKNKNEISFRFIESSRLNMALAS